MNTKIILLLGLLTLATICTARPAEEEYEYEEEPAPVPKKAPARPLVGRRNPLAGKNNKAASSTTTTTAAPQEEEEVAAVEGDYEDEQPVETSSTTEASKKFLRGGVIRPFRSNTDLLATLKKRREQVVTNKVKPAATEQREEVASEPVQKESKSAPASGRRNRFSKAAKASNNEVSDEASSTAAPARTSRGRFNSRS